MPFYAVARGRSVGTYRTWPECEAQVKGFNGARYKKWSTEAEALAFIEQHKAGASGVASASSSASATTQKAGTKRKAGAVDDETSKPAAKARRTSSGAADAASSASSASSSARLIKVYTDGACSSNGKSGARAGWGVWFQSPELQHLNESKRLPGALQTNNRAELMVSGEMLGSEAHTCGVYAEGGADYFPRSQALIRACQLCPEAEARLEIYTDSQYSMKGE